MSSQTITLPPYRADTVLTSDNNRITPDAHRSLLQLYNATTLITISTANGSANFQVPLAKLNQGQRRTYKKISTDANVPTLVPTAGSTDKIEFGAALAMGTAQGSKVSIQSDGVSNWYVVA